MHASHSQDNPLSCWRGRRGPVLGASLAAAALLASAWAVSAAGPALAASKSTTNPRVLNCGTGKGLAKPASLTVACADGNNVGKDLTWSKWASTGASAKGTDSWNPCTPTCAADKHWDSAAATFALSDAVHTSKGLLFEKLAVHVTGTTPKGVARSYVVSEAPVSG
jgi:hypothetical protein